MGTSPNLAIPEVDASQNQKEVTINNAFTALDNAANATLAIDLTIANAATVSPASFRAYANFECSGHYAAAILTVPAGIKRMFHVSNRGAFQITVKYPTGQTVIVAPTSLAGIVGNGTDLMVLSAGQMALDELIDVDVPTPASNDVLMFDGTRWVGQQMPAGAPVGFADLTGQADYSMLPAELAKVPLAFIIQGKPVGAQVYNLVLPYDVTIPANFAGTATFCSYLPTADAVFNVRSIVAGVTTTIGLISLRATGHTDATLSVQPQVSLLAGGVLQLIAPVQDPTLSDVGITIAALRA